MENKDSKDGISRRKFLKDMAAGMGSLLMAPSFPLETPIQAHAQSQGSQLSNTIPVIPVGLDAYRKWELWPIQRIGVRAHMRSTYDRSGGNESADASHFCIWARKKTLMSP